jgi:hypothetical protein
MNTTRNLITRTLVVGGLLTLATPALADHRDRRRDLRELEAARRELRRDLRRGASPAEIARDRASIARERRDLWRDREYWSWNRWHRYDDRYYERWHRYDNRYYNRWNRRDRWDRGWHRGWWR